MAEPVTEQTLLEGSWLALAQAGRLMHSAVTVFESGDFSTAVAVAMFGREELGRSRILRQCAGDVRAGRRFEVKDIVDQCNHHVDKQDASAFSTTMRPAADSQVGKALRALMQHEPMSDQYRAAQEVVDAAVAAKQRRQPHDRHEIRCSGLYVDLNQSGADWAYPGDMDKRGAYDQLQDAINGYSLEYQRLVPDELFLGAGPHVSVEEMRAARAKMTRKLEILPPRWPQYGAG